MGAKHVRIGCADVARLFAHHDCQGVGLFADAFCGTMSKTELLWNVEVVTDGQDARSCCYPSFRDYHGAVVKRTVLEENVLDEPLCYLGVNLFARSHELAKRQVVLQDDEGSDMLLAHVHAGHDDGEDCLALVAELTRVLVLIQSEESEEPMSLVSSSYVVEEASDVFLEEDDDGKCANADKLVEDASQQLHFQHLADDNPEADEKQNAIEDVDGARLLHQLVAIEEYYRHKENVDEVFETYVRHSLNSLIISIHSIASFTS